MDQEKLSQLVNDRRWAELKEEVVKLHPVDLARLLSELDFEERRRVVKMVPHETVENLLPELPEDLLIEVILAFPSSQEKAPSS
ncbi:MAG: hypothetical protein GTO54_05460 [Nitrososphaeria archaeon]|nr:hypothetical protein [Nitrososphaeria archaeon]